MTSRKLNVNMSRIQASMIEEMDSQFLIKKMTVEILEMRQIWKPMRIRDFSQKPMKM